MMPPNPTRVDHNSDVCILSSCAGRYLLGCVKTGSVYSTPGIRRNIAFVCRMGQFFPHQFFPHRVCPQCAAGQESCRRELRPITSWGQPRECRRAGIGALIDTGDAHASLSAAKNFGFDIKLLLQTHVIPRTAQFAPSLHIHVRSCPPLDMVIAPLGTGRRT